MFKYLVLALMLFIALPAKAEPFVSPQMCKSLSEDLYSVGSLRDAKTPIEKVFDELLVATQGDTTSIPYKFYSYWINVIFSSPKPSQELAMEFYFNCMKEKGDLAKLYGKQA